MLLPNDDEQTTEIFRKIYGPMAPDTHILGWIQLCWRSLPKERQNLDDFEADVRRRIDRLFRATREDEAEQRGSN